ncbi:hypothetical protein DFH09DRAFT_1073203 [Mycena vulgaris]|nr:hypothetical protein DFH09DRAFT_1073203 [Mycena vulgaris]
MAPAMEGPFPQEAWCNQLGFDGRVALFAWSQSDCGSNIRGFDGGLAFNLGGLRRDRFVSHPKNQINNPQNRQRDIDKCREILLARGQIAFHVQTQRDTTGARQIVKRQEGRMREIRGRTQLRMAPGVLRVKLTKSTSGEPGSSERQKTSSITTWVRASLKSDGVAESISLDNDSDGLGWKAKGRRRRRGRRATLGIKGGVCRGFGSGGGSRNSAACGSGGETEDARNEYMRGQAER